MAFQEGLASFASGAVTFGIILLAVVVAVGLIALGIWLFHRWKKYQEFRVVVWERDGLGNVREYYDAGGVFVDNKTKNKRLFLKRSNVGLEPDKIPYVLVGDKKVVYVVRRGLKNFQYIKPKISETGFEFRVTEEDVNWAINAFERQKKMFQENKLLQFLPFIMLAFVSIIILVIFIYFFKDFAVLKDVAMALHETAVVLKSGVVLQ